MVATLYFSVDDEHSLCVFSDLPFLLSGEIRSLVSDEAEYEVENWGDGL